MTIHKTVDRKQILSKTKPTKTQDEFEMVSSSCSTSGTHRVIMLATRTSFDMEIRFDTSMPK